MGRTQEERKADTRSRLLRAATELFARRGIDGVSVDAIAQHADRTSGSVYSHFGGKQGLLLGVLDRWAAQVARAMAEDMAHSPTIRDRLAATWRNFADHPDRDDRPLWLFHELWLRAARDPEVGSELTRRYGEARAAMASAYATWSSEAGLDLPIGPDDLAVAAFGLLLGLDMQRQLDPSAVTDDLATTALAILFGLGPEAADSTKGAARAHADL